MPKKASRGTLLQTSTLYIRCIYSLLEECRPYILFCNVMASIREEKWGPKKCLGRGSKAIWAMPIYTDHFSKRAFPYREIIFIASPCAQAQSSCTLENKHASETFDKKKTQVTQFKGIRAKSTALFQCNPWIFEYSSLSRCKCMMDF